MQEVIYDTFVASCDDRRRMICIRSSRFTTQITHLLFLLELIMLIEIDKALLKIIIDVLETGMDRHSYITLDYSAENITALKEYTDDSSLLSETNDLGMKKWFEVDGLGAEYLAEFLAKKLREAGNIKDEDDDGQ